MSADFKVDLSELSGYLRDAAARHLQQTLDMHYDGKSQRGAMANYFRIDPETNYDPAPAAVAFRTIVAGVRADGRAKVWLGALDGWHKVKVHDMLDQTWRRVEGEGSGTAELAECLSQLLRAYDQAAGVSEDAGKRLAMQSRPAAERYQQQRKAEARKTAEDRRAKVRADEERSRRPDEDGTFEPVAGGGFDFMPMRGR